MPRFIDLKGQVFGRLTVLGRADDGSGPIRWLCRCECGRRTAVIAGNLRSGNTASCGCRKEELRIAAVKRIAAERKAAAALRWAEAEERWDEANRSR